MKQDSGNESTERLGVPSAEMKPTSGLGAARSWEYVETEMSAVVIAGNYRLQPHWRGLGDSDAIRQVMKLAAAAPALYAALKEILNYGVEFDDERIGYVNAQVDRGSIADARAALALVDGQRTNTAKREQLIK